MPRKEGSVTDMPTYHDIHIRFIRRRQGGVAEENPLLDDILRITKLGENNLRVTYTERSEDGTMSDSMLMGYQRFLHYVWRLLWLLSVDADPFQSVQLMIPGYPVVLIPVSTMTQNMTTIMDILLTTCWQWPVVRRPEPGPPISILRRPTAVTPAAPPQTPHSSGDEED